MHVFHFCPRGSFKKLNFGLDAPVKVKIVPMENYEIQETSISTILKQHDVCMCVCNLSPPEGLDRFGYFLLAPSLSEEGFWQKNLDPGFP